MEDLAKAPTKEGLSMPHRRGLKVIPFASRYSDALSSAVSELAGEPYPGELAGTTSASMRAWLELPDFEARWVAVSGEKVAGHVGVAAGEKGALEVCRLFVTPSFRGIKLGRRLLDEVFAYAQARPLTLKVSPYLTPAIELYLRCGFCFAGSVQSELNTDTLLVLEAKPRF